MLLTTVSVVVLEDVVAAIGDVAGLHQVEKILLQGTLVLKTGSH
jgi:rRNA processing protein Krr1/Pno1